MAATPITDGVSLESLFRDFYEHVVALKGRIQAAPAQSSEPQTPEADRPDGMTPQEVHEELVSFLKTQEAGALRLPGIRPDNYLDAQYVMAATADEVFLNIPWDGRPYWTDNLLESSLFESHVAGERLFRKLDIGSS